MMAGAMALPSMSASDCVAKRTEAFFLRSVFSHSRSWREPMIVEREPAFVDDDECGTAVEPILYAVEEIERTAGAATASDQPFGLEGLNLSTTQMFCLGVEQAAPCPPTVYGCRACFSALDCSRTARP